MATFGDLRVGQRFVYRGNEWMKIECVDYVTGDYVDMGFYPVNAVCLQGRRAGRALHLANNDRLDEVPGVP